MSVNYSSSRYFPGRSVSILHWNVETWQAFVLGFRSQYYKYGGVSGFVIYVLWDNGLLPYITPSQMRALKTDFKHLSWSVSRLWWTGGGLKHIFLFYLLVTFVCNLFFYIYMYITLICFIFTAQRFFMDASYFDITQTLSWLFFD